MWAASPACTKMGDIHSFERTGVAVSSEWIKADPDQGMFGIAARLTGQVEEDCRNVDLPVEVHGALTAHNTTMQPPIRA